MLRSNPSYASQPADTKPAATELAALLDDWCFGGMGRSALSAGLFHSDVAGAEVRSATTATSKRSADVKGRNYAPVAKSDAVTTDEDHAVSGNVLANDTDRNGDPLSVVAVNGKSAAVGQTITLTSGALLTLQGDGTFVYDPNGRFESLSTGTSALDRFTYVVADGRGKTATGTATVTIKGVTDAPVQPVIEPVNRAPVAVADGFTTDEDHAVSGSVLANDTDPDGDPLHVVAVNGQAAAVGQAVTLASGARLTLKADGTFAYDPNGKFEALNTGQSGTDFFDYTISDGAGGSAAARVTITVNGVTDAVAPPPVPYYVSDLLISSAQRWNYPDPYGTADTVTYAFLSSPPAYYATTHWAWTSFRAFTPQQQDMTRQAINEMQNFTNLKFVETTPDKAAITFGIADIAGGYIGYAYYPGGSGINSMNGDVWIDDGWAGSSFTAGTGPYKTLIHELGHAVGLDHPSSAMPAAENNRMYTVMSYSGPPQFAGEPSTYMPYDVATLQFLYGTNQSFRSGNDSYDYATLANQLMTIWDGGGTDTIDCAAATTEVTIDLNPGSYSTIGTNGSKNVAIAFGCTIENAFGGGGHDTLTGNAANNILRGGAGNDTLTGGAGNDSFVFDVGWGSDTVTDFEKGFDHLDFRGTSLTWAALTISDVQGQAVVSDGTNHVTLLGVSATALDLSDFYFAAALS